MLRWHLAGMNISLHHPTTRRSTCLRCRSGRHLLESPDLHVLMETLRPPGAERLLFKTVESPLAPRLLASHVEIVTLEQMFEQRSRWVSSVGRFTFSPHLGERQEILEDVRDTTLRCF